MEEIFDMGQKSPERTDVNLWIFPHLKEFLVIDLSPNPPKDTDGRREGSGRGWVRELQGRWPGVLG